MKQLLTLLLMTISFAHLQADGFLTSTTFSEAYQNVRIIKVAKKTGQLNKRLIKYILNKRKPVALKLAIVNELGWNFQDKKKNSEILLDYVLKKKIYQDYKQMIDQVDEDVLICIAYMEAMENYFSVRKAMSLARRAQIRNKSSLNPSYTINLVSALIQAQHEKNRENSCKAFQICDAVRPNNALEMDLDDQALKIVFDYVDLYKDYCN